MLRDSKSLGGRLELLSPQSLDRTQKALYDEIDAKRVPWSQKAGFVAKLDGGQLIGPFNVLLYRPEISQGYLTFTDAETANTSLDSRVREVVILSVGAAWNAGYELYAHSAVAGSAGLSDSAVRALVAGESSDDLSATEKLAYRVTRQLTVRHRLDSDLFEEARAAFGQAGLIDITFLIGRYVTICALLNAFEVPAPSGLT